jgi:hypothetical protein
MPAEKKTPTAPAVILVPCAETERAGCRIVRRAVEIVAAKAPEEVTVATPEECRGHAKPFIVAVDGSSACQAMGGLREVGMKPAQVVSAPAVLAASGLLRPGVNPKEHVEELAQALAAGIRESLARVLEETRARRRYQQEMAPVMQRFRGLWEKLEALETPNGHADPAAASRVELLGRRARNLFTKFDEVVPPAEWSEPHDLFQDALLCIAYATEGWAHGDAGRWEQNMEKAKAQLRPLLRRLEG